MSENSDKYVKIVSLKIRQPFYTNGICRSYCVSPLLDFDIVPTMECLGVMKRLGMIYKKDEREGGCFVLAKTKKIINGESRLYYSPLRNEALYFSIVLKNPYVLNFNELPVGELTNTIYYFTNKNKRHGEKDGGQQLSYLLSGVSGDYDRLLRISSNYKYRVDKHNDVDDVYMLHELTGRVVYPYAITDCNECCEYGFSLVGIEIGKMMLFVNGNKQNEMFFCGDGSCRVFGIIEVSLSDELSEEYMVVGSKGQIKEKTTEFQVLFPSRKTIWRYTVHLTSENCIKKDISSMDEYERDKYIKKLNIVANDKSLRFYLSEYFGDKIIFLSDKYIDMKEEYVVAGGENINNKLRLTLKRYIGDGEKESIVKADLPLAGIDIIDSLTFPEVYSDICITI